MENKQNSEWKEVNTPIDLDVEDTSIDLDQEYSVDMFLYSTGILKKTGKYLDTLSEEEKEKEKENLLEMTKQIDIGGDYIKQLIELNCPNEINTIEEYKSFKEGFANFIIRKLSNNLENSNNELSAKKIQEQNEEQNCGCCRI